MFGESFPSINELIHLARCVKVNLYFNLGIVLIALSKTETFSWTWAIQPWVSADRLSNNRGQEFTQCLTGDKPQDYISGTFLTYKHVHTKSLWLPTVNPHAEIYDRISKPEEIKRNKFKEIVQIVS